MNNYPVALILLGAGDAKRFGGRKQFALIDGKPMYQYILEAVSPIHASSKIMVTQFSEMAEAAKQASFFPLLNQEPQLGISHSIELALTKCCEEEGYLFAVCDQPYLKTSTIERLLGTFINSPKGIVCLSFQGEIGNPVIFHKKYRDELLMLTGDTGGKKVMKRHLDDVIYVEADSKAELYDIDYPEDMDQK